MELLRKLKQREANHDPIRIGIVGCGQMGSGLAHTITNIRGMQVRAIADIDPQKAVHTFLEMKVDKKDIYITDHLNESHDLLKKGKFVITPDPSLLPRLESLEVNIEATGDPDTGASIAYESILLNKPVIMINVETDVTIGYYLNHLAREKGSLYTVASGDEPGVLKTMHEQAVLMGFEVVCLGKGKNNTIDLASTPEKYREEALSKGMNPRILSSFKDGTKTMVEMAAVANGTGLIPDVPGMHGPKAELEELVTTFIPQEDGGIFSGKGRVDYTTGDIAPGVFTIVYTGDPRMRKDMKFITHKDGPYYLLFRPYHLCDLETPQSIAEAVLLNEPTITAEYMKAEVVAVAKRDLKKGQKVKEIGYEDFYGKIFAYPEAKQLQAIPIGIAEHGIVLRDIPKGAPFTKTNFKPDTGTFVYKMRQEQEKLLNDE